MLKFLNILYQIFRYIRDCVISLFFILFVMICFSLIALFNSTEKPAKTASSGALLLQLDGYLADNREEYSEFYRLLGENEAQKISTFDVADAILAAKDDENITGLVLDLGKLQSADLATLDYLGSWVARFKESGKPVIAIGNAYSQAQYYLASFADEIYLNPVGSVDLHGLNYSNLYFKALLDKVKAVPQVFRVGTYKSAVEPFIRNNMSPEARQNASLFIHQLWQQFVERIAHNREIAAENVLPQAAQYLTLFKQANADEAQYALKQKLVTQLATRAEIETLLQEKFGKDAEGDFNHIDFEDYVTGLVDRFDVGNRAKIAVINVEGEITLGESEGANAGSASIIRALQQANRDSNVEAVILRVNSPGGSAVASELIRQEIEAIQQAGKPVVVSMGGMAASGGYWIAATSDKIVANPQTITGSIGIFGLSLSFEKTAKELGVNEDGITTSPLAQNSVLKPLNADQAKLLQMSIERGYDQFLSLVSKGRKMSKAQVDKIAQGQVWTGTKAKELGLVDELGDFETAFNIASQLVDAKREKEGKATGDYPAQWFTDEEDTSLRAMLSKLKLKTQISLAKWFDLPLLQALQPVKASVNELSKFNDPKNIYLYCLNCGVVR